MSPSRRKHRILHTLGWVSSGGVEQRRLMLARTLPRDRYEHLVICQDSGGALPDLLRAEGWPVHEIGLAPHILSPAWHRSAYDIARAFQPDLIHGAVIEGVALANGIGLRMPRVKVISEETSDPEQNRSWRGNLLMRGMCIRSSAVVGVSPLVGDYLRDRARIPARKVRVIDNAVLPAPEVTVKERAALRHEFGLNKGELIIGSVRRLLDSHKRFSDLIRAVALLRDRGIHARLLIVGGGTDHDMLVALANSLGLGDIVVFTGYRRDARRFYPLMDVAVLASAHEAFGLVLVEAMLAGVPVVASRVGGIPYVLDDGAAGILATPGQPAEFAAALERLLGDSALRAMLGKAGRFRAETAFSAERYCRDIDALYRELLT